ncbi:MAG: hypothetical protein ACRELF_29100 [Gemmataceae bacterium]
MSANANNADEANGADDAVRDFADLERLRQLYQSFAPPQPDQADWNAVLARIHQDASNPEVRRLGSRRPLWAILAAVAAILAVVLLVRSLTTKKAATPTIEPFAVVDAEDVVIVSMDAADVVALVVGEPPVGDDLEFVRPQDIRVIQCKRCPHSGALARLDPDGEVPMFVSAADANQGNEP